MLVQRTTFGWDFDASAVGLGVVHTGFEYELNNDDGLVSGGVLTVDEREHVLDLEPEKAFQFRIRPVASNSSDNGPWAVLDVQVGDLTSPLPAVTGLAVTHTELVEVE